MSLAFRSWVVVAIAALSWLWTTTVRAEPTDAERDDARRLYHLGNDRYADGDFRAAMDAFAKADAIMKVPTTGIGLGKSQVKVGLLIEAHATLQRVARHPPSDDEPPPFAEARREATELVPDVARRIPSVVVQVSGVDASTAIAVELDGKALALPAGALETTFQVNPGEHTLVVRAKDRADGRASFSVVESEKKVVGVLLAPIARSVAPEPTPPPGDHTATVAVMWTGFAVGLAGVVAGSVTGALSLSTSSDLDAACTPVCPESARADHDEAIALANASNVTFAIGAAGLVAGVIALVVLVTSSDDGATSVRSAPGTIGIEF